MAVKKLETAVKDTSRTVSSRKLPAVAVAGWGVLVVCWGALAYRVAYCTNTPALAVVFSGWTAVVATAVGGLPLLLLENREVPEVRTAPHHTLS